MHQCVISSSPARAPTQSAEPFVCLCRKTGQRQSGCREMALAVVMDIHLIPTVTNYLKCKFQISTNHIFFLCLMLIYHIHPASVSSQANDFTSIHPCRAGRCGGRWWRACRRPRRSRARRTLGGCRRLRRRGRRGSGAHCIKIGLPGKSILRDYFQEIVISRRTFLLLRISFPGRPFFIQFVPWVSCRGASWAGRRRRTCAPGWRTRTCTRRTPWSSLSQS